MRKINQSCNISIERMVNETLWKSIMGHYGEKGQFDNDVFAVKAYNWEFDEENDWHFWHKPSGLKVQWYKYPLRSPYANMEITNEEFYAVLQDSMNSVRSTYRDCTFNPWWEKEEIVMDNKEEIEKMKQDIFEFCEANEVEETLLFDNPGYETAFLGLDFNSRAVYSYNKMVEYLMEQDGMTLEEAEDFISYNTLRACGYTENSPVIIVNEYKYALE